MSRVGNKTIPVPAKVTLKAAGPLLTVEGPKGSLSLTLPEGISFSQEGATVTIARKNDDRKIKALHGTNQRLVTNMIKGVSEGFVKNLEIQGVGFRAAVKEDKIDLSLGYSHPILHPIEKGLTVVVTDNTKISVSGIDKQRVGQLAADIRSYYPPEPYKGKGVRYAGEIVRRKEGKKSK